MITSQKLRQCFHSLKLHFRNEYDYFTYGSNARIKESQELDRAFLYLPYKLVTEDNAVKYFVANFVDYFIQEGRVASHITDFSKSKSISTWKGWEGRIERIEYLVKQEINSSGKTIEELISLDDPYMHPLIISLCLSKKMSFETFAVVVSRHSDIFERWLSVTSDTIFLPEYIKFIKAYTPFVKKYVVEHREKMKQL